MRTMLVLLLAVGSVGSAVALDPLRFQWDSPVGIVTRLYHDYAFSAVLDFNAPYGPVENEPRRVLEKYFDATLTEDLLRDQRCAVQSGGVCNLDFQPMWNSQDQIGTTVEDIEDLPKAGDVAVILNYNQTSQKDSAWKAREGLGRWATGYEAEDVPRPCGSALRMPWLNSLLV